MTNYAPVIFILFGLHLCSGTLPTVPLLDFAANGNEMAWYDIPNGPSYNAAGGKYIFVRSVVGEGDVRFLVHERDDQGHYTTTHQAVWTRKSFSMATNGNWFGTLGDGYVELFQLGAAGAFVNFTRIASTATVMQILSDNTLVLLQDSSVDTYQQVGGNWIEVQSQNVNFTVMLSFEIQYGGSDDDSTPHLTDTTLAAFNPIRNVTELYTRNSDKSWTLVDEISIDMSEYRANRILWDGADTVVLAHTTYNQDSNYGRIIIYQKINDSWNVTKIIPNTAVASSQPGHLGHSMLLYDQNTIFVSAPSENVNEGEVLLLKRVDGEWNFVLRFIGQDTRKYFGYNLMKNDYDIILQTATSTTIFQTYQVVISPCYLPMKVACQNVIVDTCHSAMVPYNQLYAIGDKCTVARLQNILIEDQVTTLMFQFSRDFSDTFYCNATITCPSPPVTPANTTPLAVPSIISNPVTPPSTTPGIVTPSASPSAPVVSPVSQPFSLPMSHNTPVASPSELGQVTSSGSSLCVSSVLSIIVLFVEF